MQQTATARSNPGAALKAEQRRQREALVLTEAIEEDCAAIALLLQTCGSSRDFGLEELHKFEKLIRHRRRLLIRLERLRRTLADNDCSARHPHRPIKKHSARIKAER